MQHISEKLYPPVQLLIILIY